MWLPHKQVLKSIGISDSGMFGHHFSRLTGAAADRREMLISWAIIGLQSIAALFFGFDIFSDYVELGRTPVGAELVVEGLVTLGLVAGIMLGLRHSRRLAADIRRKDDALSVARGALSAHVSMKFAEWGLSASEAEVAMLAIKGFQIAEIAKIRKAATGTVRSQLSQVYAKAQVSSQSMLVASFLDDLLDGVPSGQ